MKSEQSKSIQLLFTSTLVLSSLIFSTPSFGGVEEKIEELEQKIESLENVMKLEKEAREEHLSFLERDLSMVDYRTARIKALGEKVDAFTLGGDLTFILQGISDKSNGGSDRVDGTYSADLFLTIPVGPYGNVFMRGDIGEGDGIAGYSSAFSGPNADLEFNDSQFTLVEAFYWTSFPVPDVRDQRLELIIGKIDPSGIFDANSVANSETDQFMADIFVNNLAVEFAGDENGYGPGVVLGHRFTSIYQKGLEVTGRVGLFEGDINGEGTFNRVFDNPFIIGELDIARSYYGLEGNYRIYGWKNQSKHEDLADATKNDLDNSGFGFSLDQQVSNDVTLFARYGYQDGDVSEFDHNVTIGGQIIGNAWRRGSDVIGVAYGLSKTSSKYRGASGVSGDEHYIEAYYKYWANGNLSISPDLQYVINPAGDKNQDDFFIYAVRMHVHF